MRCWLRSCHHTAVSVQPGEEALGRGTSFLGFLLPACGRVPPAPAHLDDTHSARHAVALAVHVGPKGALRGPQRRQHGIGWVACGGVAAWQRD